MAIRWGRYGTEGALQGNLGPRHQLLRKAAANKTSAASEREVVITVLSHVVGRAEVLDKIAFAVFQPYPKAFILMARGSAEC